MPPSAQSTDANSSAPTAGVSADTTARDYFRVALRIVGRSPLLAAWKIVGDLIGMLLRPVAFLWITTLTFIAFRAGGLESVTPGGIMAVVDRLAPVTLAIGAGGIAVTLWLVGATFDAFISGGLFASIARGLGDIEVDGLGDLLECVSEGFPRVFLLRLAGGAAELTVALLGICVVIAIATPFMSYGELATWSNASKVMLIAGPLFLFLSLGLLVRLTFQVATAPLFIDDTTVGEAIAEGAQLLINRLAGVYKLLVFGASLLLVPLFAYWGWVMLDSLWGMQSAFAPLFSAGRIVGQTVLYTGISFIAVLFYGAIFAYYAALTGRMTIEASSTDEETSSAGGAADHPPEYDRKTRIADLLPEQNDRVVNFSDIPGLEEDETDSKE